MQAVKTINLANNLKRAGRNVLLGIDNFKDILQAEWHMLQLLQGSNLDIKKKAGDTINYNSLKLSPISILNEVYSGCVDHTKNPPIVNKKIKGGSFTSIIATENEH